MTAFRGNAAPLSSSGFRRTMVALATDPASLWALITVETSGFGYLPDRRPKILFERHVFHRRTGGKYGSTHADISAPAPGGYLGDADEYTRLERALALDRQAALDSTSWGLGQVMGFHAASLGYPGTEAMVTGFLEDEDAQLEAVQRFIGAHAALRQALRRQDWTRVAFFYNGASYAQHGYHRKLEHYHDLYAIKGTPDIAVRTAQAWLTYLGYAPRGVDGILGPATGAAVVAFQKAQGLPVTADLDDASLERLRLAAAAAAGRSGA
ncbi:N-acetylmuramidase domain-containing protein [Massilia sp. TN1-12]|uniref:N-acetylmuramidase domain-containing protein n=1 Tax=Massilia paldalensis TaxID=3377675 RepID=UPI00384F5380